MSTGFGPGTTPKSNVMRWGHKDLMEVDLWASNGTNNTASVGYDATYGSYFRQTLAGADNDEGSYTFDLGTIFRPVNNSNFCFEGLVKLTEAATDNMEFDFGFADVTADLVSDTPSSHVNTTDHLTIGKVAESLFWRGFFGNDATQVTSGATTTAMASGTWYRLKIEGMVRTDGLHARFSVDDNVIYTIGYGSSVAAQSVSGFTAMYPGVWVKATNTNAEVCDFIPLKLELEQSAT